MAIVIASPCTLIKWKYFWRVYSVVEFGTLAMFGWYRLVVVVVVIFNTSKLTHKKLTPLMFGWRC
jgi:hypothetical protein